MHIIIVILLIVAAILFMVARYYADKALALHKRYWELKHDVDHLFGRATFEKYKEIQDKFAEAEENKSFECHPILQIKKEFQVNYYNIDKIEELVKDGGATRWTLESNSCPSHARITVETANGQTVHSGEWLMLDTDGDWLKFSDKYHKKLVEYNKIQLIKNL